MDYFDAKDVKLTPGPSLNLERGDVLSKFVQDLRVLPFNIDLD
jgi:hypothetical protein